MNTYASLFCRFNYKLSQAQKSRKFQHPHSLSRHLDSKEDYSSTLYYIPIFLTFLILLACFESRVSVNSTSSASFFTVAFLTLSSISAAKSLNISAIPSLLFALTSQYSIPYLSARASPRSLDIFLGQSWQLSSPHSSSTSILFATNTFLTDSVALILTCSTQCSILRKVSYESTAQTMMIPAAPLQQVSVIVLNLS